MKREEAVSLLKEIMTDCESFHTAKAVSIQYDRTNDSWALSVTWLPYPSETDCLNKIIAKHNLEMTTKNERTIFHSS